MPEDPDLDLIIDGSSEFDWLQEAMCGNLGLDALRLYFLEAGSKLSKEALAICNDCAVRVDCLRHAYEHEIQGGYFGGLSPSQRRDLTLEQATALVRSRGPPR